MGMLVSGLVIAQDVSELFAESRVMYQSSQTDQLYRLVLSAPKKVNSRWEFERVERMKSAVTRKTLEIDSTYSFAEINRRLDGYYRSELGRLIYSCHGLDCGSSNAWANEVFRVKQLYGLDTRQEYEVWELAGGASQRFVISYLVQRGNQRVYLQLETVHPSTPITSVIVADPRTIINQLSEQGFYEISGSLTDPGENPHIDSIARALRMKPMMKIAVVGHSYSGVDPEKKQRDSEIMAKAMRDALIAKGVSDKQLSAYGIGSLAPQGRTAPKKLVLVVL